MLRALEARAPSGVYSIQHTLHHVWLCEFCGVASSVLKRIGQEEALRFSLAYASRLEAALQLDGVDIKLVSRRDPQEFGKRPKSRGSGRHIGDIDDAVRPRERSTLELTSKTSVVLTLPIAARASVPCNLPAKTVPTG